MKKLFTRLILLFLTVFLLLTLFGCASCDDPPEWEYVTEDAPVRNPEDIYIETVEEQYFHGTVVAVCGEDLLRVNVQASQVDQYGKTVYIRTSEIENAYQWYSVYVVFDTVERSSNPDDLPIFVAKEIHVEMPDAKPVIYLYPETPTEVSVNLTLNGLLTCTYPDYDKGWQGFTAHPDGTLIFPDDKEYYCLYWEGMQTTEWDFSKGFCVKGEDTAAFLEWVLAEQGLTAREANEFIIYWLPLMQENPYNVISFQTDAYTDGAVLEITPAPDSLIRVFMAWYATDTAVELSPQAFDPPVRDGFTVVEWGGSQGKAP